MEETNYLPFIIYIMCILMFFCMGWKHSYWWRRGIEYLRPELVIGNMRELLMNRMSFGEQFVSIYNEMKSLGWKYGGVYSFFEPVFMPLDLDLVRSIMQIDFDHFRNHGMYVNEKADPLTGHLFNLEDEKWRKLRAKLTPAFTSGKMKMMFPILMSSTTNLVSVLQDLSRRRDPIDARDVFSRFTTDVIGSVAFGIDCNSLRNPGSELREFGKRVFRMDLARKIKAFIIMFVPRNVLVALGFREISKDIENFFMKVVRDAILYRKSNNILRKDFLQMMLQLQNRGEVPEGEDPLPAGAQPVGEFLTFNELVAQCFMFFIAGFETSASAMTFALLELAQNQDVQDQAREEIQRVMEEFDGEITYHGIMRMNYLDRVVKETLRKHPPIPVMTRVCNTEFKIPGTDIIIEEGTKVHIPFQAIHMDPQYYPDPQRFDPERFTTENKVRRHPYCYLPFGEGPRMCIGTRFGMLEVKVALTAVLMKFKVKLDRKTKIPIKYSSNSFISSVAGGVWIRLSELR